MNNSNDSSQDLLYLDYLYLKYYAAKNSTNKHNN